MPTHVLSHHQSTEDLPELEEVKLWTRSCLHEFKQVLITDPESILEIGSGEIVTVSFAFLFLMF